MLFADPSIVTRPDDKLVIAIFGNEHTVYPCDFGDQRLFAIEAPLPPTRSKQQVCYGNTIARVGYGRSRRGRRGSNRTIAILAVGTINVTVAAFCGVGMRRIVVARRECSKTNHQENCTKHGLLLRLPRSFARESKRTSRCTLPPYKLVSTLAQMKSARKLPERSSAMIAQLFAVRIKNTMKARA